MVYECDHTHDIKYRQRLAQKQSLAIGPWTTVVHKISTILCWSYSVARYVKVFPVNLHKVAKIWQFWICIVHSLHLIWCWPLFKLAMIPGHFLTCTHPAFLSYAVYKNVVLYLLLVWKVLHWCSILEYHMSLARDPTSHDSALMPAPS